MHGPRRRSWPWPVLLVLLAPAALLSVGAGEESTTAAVAPRRQFDDLLGQWKSLLVRMEVVWARSLRAPPEERAQLEEEYEKLVAQGSALATNLRKAAEKAYLDAPEKQDELAQFLVVLVGDECTLDHYEEAFRLAKILIDNKHNDKVLYCCAGIAAFCVGEFELAKEWLKDARGFEVFIRRIPPKVFVQLQRNREHCLEQIEKYEKEESWKDELAARAKDAQANRPRVLLKTTKGEIELELFEEQAPNTVANFIFLVEDAFYDGLPFFLVIPGFFSPQVPGGIARSGCPYGDGSGDPDYFIESEADRPDARCHFRGSISMYANPQGRLGSQFFICMVPHKDLDESKHTVFGRVIRGMDVVTGLQARNPNDQDAPKPDRILEATVIRKGDHPYVPQKWSPEDEKPKAKPDAKQKPTPNDQPPDPADDSAPQGPPSHPAGVV